MKNGTGYVIALTVALFAILNPGGVSADSRIKFSSTKARQRKAQNFLQQTVLPAVRQINRTQTQPVRYQQQTPQRTTTSTYQQHKPANYGTVNSSAASNYQRQTAAPTQSYYQNKPKKTRSLGPFAKTAVSLCDAFDPYAKTVLSLLAVPCLIFILIARRRGEGFYIMKVARLSIVPGAIAVVYGIFIDDWSMSVGEWLVQGALLFELIPILYSCWVVTQISGGMAYKIFALLMLILTSLFAVLISALAVGLLIVLLIVMIFAGNLFAQAKEKPKHRYTCGECGFVLPSADYNECPRCRKRFTSSNDINDICF